ncbi:hypothetical protein NP233_g10173 [Leucocoprinus birnbaumii]|uniref:Uncharacterized protein n=1 Tax=Leucocoprinus birnbaumii TaxID=56174 RepID=A0AAD5VLF6_9AGAR|nr:hypothetical protein NP233_g10173 [Leucocoprinus birnbaumii]
MPIHFNYDNKSSRDGSRRPDEFLSIAGCDLDFDTYHQVLIISTSPHHHIPERQYHRTLAALLMTHQNPHYPGIPALLLQTPS